MDKPTFRIAILPPVSASDTGDVPQNELISRVRSFRLEMLKTSPDDFGSTYENEVQYPLEWTRKRLSNAQNKHYVVVPTNSAIEVVALHADDWVGMVAMRGPETESANARAEIQLNPWDNPPEPNGMDAQAELSLHYHFGGLFVKPAFRGQGIAEAMLRKAVGDAEAVAKQRNAVDVRHTLAMNADNPSAVRVYEKLGFVAVRTYWYDHPRNGQARQCQIMERLVPSGAGQLK